MKTILSLGVGVNSMALLVMAAQGIIHIDEAAFAEVEEQEETKEYWQRVVIPFCFDNNINLARISKEGKSLYDAYFEKKIIPTRAWRSCTDHYKIRVLRKYVIKKYPDEDITFLIGFASDEKERANNCDLNSKYPLIEMGIDREGCKKIIRSVEFKKGTVGLPVPVKSGCYLCPFQDEDSWIRLLVNHPEDYAKAEALEKNCSRYPEMFLAYPHIGTLELLRKQYEANQKGTEPKKKTTQRLLFCRMCEIMNEEGTVDYSGYENHHLQVKRCFPARKSVKQK